MNNKIATTNPAPVNYNPHQATLEQMRFDPVTFPRLKAIPREQAVFDMVKIVSQAFLYRGQAADPTNIQFIASSLVNEFLEDKNSFLACGDLSLAEIHSVIKSAVLGSDMFGISVSSLYRIVKEYIRGEGRSHQERVQSMKWLDKLMSRQQQNQ